MTPADRTEVWARGAAYEPYVGRWSRPVKVPAFIIWGRRDPFLGAAWGERFHQDLAGSSLFILDDAGHFVQEDKPEEVAQLIESFYARRPWET